MNKPQPTPSPMEDSRELRCGVTAPIETRQKLELVVKLDEIGSPKVIRNGHVTVDWLAVIDYFERDRRKSDIRARMDELTTVDKYLATDRILEGGKKDRMLFSSDLKLRKDTLESRLQQLEGEE